jgi:putative DNA primase/helicase
MLSTEESAQYTIKARLLANGANPDHVLIGPVDWHTGQFKALDDFAAQHTDLRLIVLDPVTSFMIGNENSNLDVRRALGPLVELAERRRVAVLGLSHLNKNADAIMVNRTLGSRAWSALPRVVWTLVRPATDRSELFLMPVKCNVGLMPSPFHFAIDSSPDYNAGVVRWLDGRPTCSIEDTAVRAGRGRPRVEECCEWLEAYMAEQGTVRSTQVYRESADAGFPAHLLQDAKKQLGIRARRTGWGAEGEWVWYVPQPLLLGDADGKMEKEART